jgi:hypothetical protein
MSRKQYVKVFCRNVTERIAYAGYGDYLKAVAFQHGLQHGPDSVIVLCK